jgi:hypothetical protein
VVHSLERQRPPAAALLVDAGPAREGTRLVRVAVEARDSEGAYQDLASPVLTVRQGETTSGEVTTHQIAPGRYEASIVADANQVLAIGLKAAAADGPSRYVVPDPNAEYRFRPADETLLKSIAEATGGAWKPTAASLRNSTAVQRTARRALWPALVIAALVLWMADILLRRVRLFERAQ